MDIKRKSNGSKIKSFLAFTNPLTWAGAVTAFAGIFTALFAKKVVDNAVETGKIMHDMVAED